MTATFSPEEAARLAAFDAAPDAPESWAATVERMARAIARKAEGLRAPIDDATWIHSFDDHERADYVSLAEAALRVVTEPADPT